LATAIDSLGSTLFYQGQALLADLIISLIKHPADVPPLSSSKLYSKIILSKFDAPLAIIYNEKI